MLALLPLLACSGPDDTAPVDIPTDDGRPTPDTATFSFDTGVDTGLNDSPENTLTFVQDGRWEMSPVGGPYTSAVGVFRVLEYQDDMAPVEDTGDPEPDDDEDDDEVELPEGTICDATFALTATAVEGCDTCDFSFDFLFYVLDGDPSLCQDPDMPMDGETRRYGFDVDAKTVYYDYGDSGLWLEWWHGVRQGDKVFFEWTATVGWIPMEDED